MCAQLHIPILANNFGWRANKKIGHWANQGTKLCRKIRPNLSHFHAQFFHLATHSHIHIAHIPSLLNIFLSTFFFWLKCRKVPSALLLFPSTFSSIGQSSFTSSIRFTFLSRCFCPLSHPSTPIFVCANANLRAFLAIHPFLLYFNSFQQFYALFIGNLVPVSAVASFRSPFLSQTSPILTGRVNRMVKAKLGCRTLPTPLQKIVIVGCGERPTSILLPFSFF